MEKIILDTNFLLIPGQYKVDIFSEMRRICPFQYELFVVDKTCQELEHLAKNAKGKDKDAAKIGLLLIKKYNIHIIVTDGKNYADDAIAALADEYIVATQDKGLKSRVKRKIIMRQKTHLELME